MSSEHRLSFAELNPSVRAVVQKAIPLDSTIPWEAAIEVDAEGNIFVLGILSQLRIEYPASGANLEDGPFDTGITPVVRRKL